MSGSTASKDQRSGKPAQLSGPSVIEQASFEQDRVESFAKQLISGEKPPAHDIEDDARELRSYASNGNRLAKKAIGFLYVWHSVCCEDSEKNSFAKQGKLWLDAINTKDGTQEDPQITEWKTILEHYINPKTSNFIEFNGLLFNFIIYYRMDKDGYIDRKLHEIWHFLKNSGAPEEECATLIARRVSELWPTPQREPDDKPLATLKSAASEVAQRKVDTPELPDGLFLPHDTFSTAHKLYGWDIIRYLDERWLPLLEAGRERGQIFASRKLLAERDPSAITAIKNYTRTDPVTGKRRQLPPRLHFPTIKEVNDHALSGRTIQLKDASRLARAANRRAASGPQKP